MKRSAVLSLALLLASRSSAATFTVTNTNDSGAGSLRQAVLDANAAGGSNTLSFGAGSGGTISLLTGLPTLSTGNVIDVSAAPSSVTISGASGLDIGVGVGSVTFTNTAAAQPALLSTNLIGYGTLVKTGAGRLDLGAVNGHVGGTAVTGGAIQIWAPGALGSGVLTLDGGKIIAASTMPIGTNVYLGPGNGTVDTAGAYVTLSGTISGTGQLIVATTGVLTVSGINTYSGGTALTSGVTALTNGGALTNSNNVTFTNGATYRALASMIVATPMTMGAGGGVIDTYGHDLTVTANIGGTGGLTKVGAGTLYLSGTNGGGAMTVNAGTLAARAINALSNTGTMTVASGAVLDVAGYTQSLTALVVPGTLKADLKAGVTNVTVTGNANLTNGTLDVKLAPGTVPTAGQVFTPVSAGSLTGTFATILAPAALSFTPTYTATDVQLTTVLRAFSASALDANGSGVAAGLEGLRSQTSASAQSALADIYQMDAPRLRQALQQFGPASLGAMQGVGFAGAGANSSSVGSRSTALADGSTRDARFVARGHQYPGTLFAMAGEGDAHGAFFGSGGPWGGFASVSGSVGKLAESVSDGGTQPGYAFNSVGLTAGLDYRLDPDLAVGASLGYMRGHASVYDPAPGVVDVDGVRPGVYAAARAGDLKAVGYVGGAVDFFKTRRDLTVLSGSQSAKGTTSGFEAETNGKVSYDLKTANWGTFSPFAGFSYGRLMMNGFSETGAGALNLTVDAQTAQSLQSSLGVRYGAALKGDVIVFRPYLSSAWRHEFIDQSRPITARFATGVGSPFTVTSGRYARDGASVGFGLAMELSESAMVSLSSVNEFRSHFHASTMDATFRLRF